VNQGLLGWPSATGRQADADQRYTFTRYKRNSGMYYVSDDATGVTTGAPGLSVLMCSRLFFPEPTNLALIGVEVTATAATAVQRLGLYADDGTGYPGLLLLDAGTVDGASSTGNKEITISAQVSGLIWLATAAQTAAATLRAYNQGATGLGFSAQPTSNLATGYQQASVTGAFPGRFTATKTSSGTHPRVYVKVA
jgi:hypothetical protein